MESEAMGSSTRGSDSTSLIGLAAIDNLEDLEAQQAIGNPQGTLCIPSLSAPKACQQCSSLYYMLSPNAVQN